MRDDRVLGVRAGRPRRDERCRVALVALNAQGDVFDGDVGQSPPSRDIMALLRAPLGVVKLSFRRVPESGSCLVSARDMVIATSPPVAFETVAVGAGRLLERGSPFHQGSTAKAE